MKPPDVQVINQELLRKTGVDFSRYRNQDLADTLANVITFPLFLARSLSRPVLLFLGLTLLAFIFTGSASFRVFLAFPGLLLAVFNGILLGLVFFIRRIRNDMNQVFTISSDLSLQVMKDIGAARANLSGGAVNFPGLLDIVHGVNSIVVLPLFMRAMDRRIPVIGGWVAGIAARFFRAVDRRLLSSIREESEQASPKKSLATPEEISSWLDATERGICYGRDNLSAVVNAVSSIVAFPFVTLFITSFLLSSILLIAAWSWLG